MNIKFDFKYLSFLIAGLISLAGIIFLLVGVQLSEFQMIGLIMLIIFLPIFFLRYEYSLLVFIIIRPIIDVYSQYYVFSISNISLNVNAVLGTALFVWGIIQILTKRLDIKKTPAFWVILALFFVNILSFFVSYSRTETIAEIIKISNIFLFFLLAFSAGKCMPKFYKYLVSALGISIIVPSLVALWQFISKTGLSFAELSNRLYGTFGHPNVLAFYLVLAISVIFLYFISTKPENRRTAVLWGLGFLFTLLLLTYSRGAWIGLVVFLFLLGFLKYHKQLLIAALSVLIVILVFQFLNAILINTFSYNLKSQPVLSRMTSNNEEADSISWRLTVLKDMLPMVWDKPVLGHGLGVFPLMRQQQDIGFFEDLNAHNDYLRLLIENGILGLGLYILLIIVLLKNAFHNYLIQPADSEGKIFALGLFGILCAFFIMSIADNMLQHTPVMWALWAFAGATLAKTSGK